MPFLIGRIDLRVEFMTEVQPNSRDSLSSVDGVVHVIREQSSLWTEGPQDQVGTPGSRKESDDWQCNLESVTGKDENSQMSRQSPAWGPRVHFSCALMVVFEALPLCGHSEGWGTVGMGSWRRLTSNRGVSWGGQVSGAEARCRPAACRRWLRGDVPGVFLAPATCAGDKGMLVRGEEGATGEVWREGRSREKGTRRQREREAKGAGF